LIGAFVLTLFCFVALWSFVVTASLNVIIGHRCYASRSCYASLSVHMPCFYPTLSNHRSLRRVPDEPLVQAPPLIFNRPRHFLCRLCWLRRGLVERFLFLDQRQLDLLSGFVGSARLAGVDLPCDGNWRRRTRVMSGQM
jgi:hypothetical protein